MINLAEALIYVHVGTHALECKLMIGKMLLVVVCRKWRLVSVLYDATRGWDGLAKIRPYYVVCKDEAGMKKQCLRTREHLHAYTSLLQSQ